MAYKIVHIQLAHSEMSKWFVVGVCGNAGLEARGYLWKSECDV